MAIAACDAADEFQAATYCVLVGYYRVGFSCLRNVLEHGRKSLRLCLAGLRIRLFDPITEATELPDHSRGTVLLRLLGDGWAPFFVTNSLVQDQPDQSTLSMGNRPDGLVMSQAWDRGPSGDTQFRRCFLWSWLRRWRTD